MAYYHDTSADMRRPPLSADWEVCDYPNASPASAPRPENEAPRPMRPHRRLQAPARPERDLTVIVDSKPPVMCDTNTVAITFLCYDTQFPSEEPTELPTLSPTALCTGRSINARTETVENPETI